MIHLGDITKIHGGTAPVVDVVIGGSPCQDLSIAGKRAGLAGKRSGLYMEQIRSIKEMREHDRANGRSGEFIRPRYMVWENVPGAFSSNHGKDFAAVLEEAVRVVEPEAPPVPVPEKGCPTSGCLMGDGWSVAWRVLDAQFWGVPQRRRRIALIADFGGHTAPEILFVRKSVSGDSEPGRTAREGTATDAEKSTGNPVFCLQGNGIDRADTAGCNGKGWKEDVCYTLNTIDRPAVYSFDSLASNSMKSSNPHSGCRAVDIAKTLDTSVPDPSKNQGGVCILDMSHACDVVRECGDVCPSLQARMGTGGNQVPLTFRQKRFGSYDRDNVAGTCKARDGKDGTTNLVCAVDCRNGTEINGTLQANSTGGKSLNLNNVVREAMTVRRLTPLECERLQGFPDGWTDIGDWVDSKGKKRQTTDSARYKALGNSIALPPWKWVLKRLCAQYERDATMASLFDGIGGFPLIWEQLNGKGSCLWASEIEEFPMAVTRKRFGGMA
nr:MAG TPA: Cytosine specific methyltransferase [Caudoviricetes sp.]